MKGGAVKSERRARRRLVAGIRLPDPLGNTVSEINPTSPIDQR